MVRLLTLLLAITLAAGCKTPPQPSLDPFLGRATVPPPKPGQVAAQRAEPYYASSPPPPASATNRLTPPAGQWSNTAPVSNASTPIRQQSYQQPIQISQPVRQPASQQPIQIVQPQPACPPGMRPVRTACPEEVGPGARTMPVSIPRAATPTPASDSVAAFRRSGEPTMAQPASATKALDEPGRLNVDSRARDIMDLPPATRPGSPAASDGKIRSASHDEPADAGSSSGLRSALNEPAKSPTVPSATIRSRYGYDDSYKWLKGQLEYSKAARRWKLRYIPLDGETDAHGGSVVLADSPQLEKFQPGDFVLVDGSIQARTDDKERSFSPLYQVARINRAKP